MKKISMLTNNRIHPSTINNELYSHQNIKSFSMFSPTASTFISENYKKAVETIVENEEEQKPKMTWGEPTWFLLHTMAEKIPEETFQERKDDILNVIYTICTNLPCQFCSDHAKEYLSKQVNFRSGAIRTRENLKEVLFQFHNFVNRRKDYPIFSREELDVKYSRANMKNIVYNFFINFQERSKNPKTLSNELYRSRIILQLKEWFKANILLFIQ